MIAGNCIVLFFASLLGRGKVCLKLGLRSNEISILLEILCFNPYIVDGRI